jgi:hypothetical protein
LQTKNWQDIIPSRPLKKMGHAKRHLVDFLAYNPDLTEYEVAQILEYVRTVGYHKPTPHGGRIYGAMVEIGQQQILVYVVETKNGLIKTGYPKRR